MKEIAPGITMLRQYGPYKNACWVLHAGREAAVVEMPPYLPSERPPYQRAESFTRRRKLRLKYALLSHCHVDHCASLPHFRRWFPSTRFVAHRAVQHDRSFGWILGRSPGFPFRDWMDGRYRLFDELFDGEFWTGSLGGEPLHVIYAPKHSYTDHLIVFRGACITGDWVLGDLRDCNAIVSTPDKLSSIERAQRIVGRLGYHVHMLFSAHGNHLVYRANFHDWMERSKVAH